MNNNFYKNHLYEKFQIQKPKTSRKRAEKILGDYKLSPKLTVAKIKNWIDKEVLPKKTRADSHSR